MPIVLVVAFLAVALAALVSRRTTRWPTIAIAGVLALLIVPFLFYFRMRVERDFGGVPSLERLPSASIPPARDFSDSGLEQLAADKPAMAARIELEKTSETSPAAVATAEAPAMPRPSWVNQPAGLHGTIYRTSVKSGLFVTQAECQKALKPKIRDAVVKYIDDYLGADAAQNVHVDDELIDSVHQAKDDYVETITSASVGPMKQMHALLEFNEVVREKVMERSRQAVITDRLGRVGIAWGVVLGLLAVVFGYLKLDILTAGQCRGRLRLAAVAAILLVATGASVARQVLQL